MKRDRAVYLVLWPRIDAVDKMIALMTVMWAVHVVEK